MTTIGNWEMIDLANLSLVQLCHMTFREMKEMDQLFFITNFV